MTIPYFAGSVTSHCQPRPSFRFSRSTLNYPTSPLLHQCHLQLAAKMPEISDFDVKVAPRPTSYFKRRKLLVMDGAAFPQ